MDGAGGYSGNGDDGLGGAARNPQNQVANKRLQQTQAKVDEVRILVMFCVYNTELCDDINTTRAPVRHVGSTVCSI